MISKKKMMLYVLLTVGLIYLMSVAFFKYKQTWPVDYEANELKELLK